MIVFALDPFGVEIGPRASSHIPRSFRDFTISMSRVPVLATARSHLRLIPSVVFI